MRGKPWTEEAQAILMRESGRRSAEEIAAMTGHNVRTINRRISEYGLTPYHASRRNMTRREKLMLGAAGVFDE